MYTLLIVEDDPVIRTGLQQNIDWNSLGFQVCGTAGDGTSACSMIATLQPDVILADIEMPNMTGLELLEHIVRQKLSVKTVFLSGHDDFHYVREALRLGATDYLLKPLHQDTAEELFRKLASDLDSHKQSRFAEEKHIQLLDLFRDELPWQAMLGYLLGHRTDLGNIQLIMEHFGFSTDNGLVLGVLRYLHSSHSDDMQNRLNQLCAVHSVTPLFIPYQKQFVFLFSCPRADAATFMADLLSADSDYQCILSNRASITTLPSIFRLLCGNLAAWFYLPNNHILQAPAVAEPVPRSQPAPKPEAYLMQIQSKNRSAVQVLLDQHMKLYCHQQTNSDIVVVQLTELYLNIAQTLQTTQPALDALRFDSLYYQLQNCLSFEYLQTCYQTVLFQLIDQYIHLCDTKGDLLGQVQIYIQQHYAENLTLNRLADIFYVHPTYLSSLFSKQAKITFTAYLRQIRLNQAASMLQSSNQSISEIAETVGYDNYQHFCKLFKTQFHDTPSAFRAKARRFQV